MTNARNDTRWEIYGETLPQAFEYLKGLYETQYRLNGLHYSEVKHLRAINIELLAALEGIANNRLSTAMPEDERVYHSYAQGWDALVTTARAAIAGIQSG